MTAARPPAQPLTAEEALIALDTVARSPSALDDMTEAVAGALAPVTGAAAACITVWDEERDILRALPGAFGASDRALPASITGPASNPRSNAARVFATGRSYMTNQACGDPGLLQSYVDVFSLTRVLSVPLDAGGRRIGVLLLVNKPEPFTVGDLAATERLAPRIAMAVDLARSMARMRVRQRLEGILAATAVAIASGRSVQDCLLPAFEELGAVTDATMVGLIPRDGPPLVWRAAAPDAAIERRFMADAGELVQRSVGRFPQAAGDPGWAALHAPVEFHGERTAALSVLRQNGEPFGGDEARVVARLADIAALAWASERYQHQLAELARSRERERIADELHDRVTQILFAAQIGLDSMLESPDDAPADTQRILEIRGLLAKGETAIRDVIHRLERTPASAGDEVRSEPGLERRLRMEVEAVEEEFGVAVHVELADGGTVAAARKPVADCLVKVAREATVNAAKHAGPCRINVDLRAGPSDRLVLTVVDDGIGVLRPSGGHGLRSLRRAVRDAGGVLRVSRAGTLGTRVTASFDH